MNTNDTNNTNIRNVICLYKNKLRNSINIYFRGPGNERVRYISFAMIILFVVFIIVYNAGISAPRQFPAGTLVEVQKGSTIVEIAEQLHEQSVIRSPFLFESFVRIFAGQPGVLSGQYYFSVSEGLFGVAKRLISGEYGLDPIRITIPEGATVQEISEVLDWKLPSFDVVGFLKLSERREGYLFPDTYFFLPSAEPAQIIGELSENFNIKISKLSDDILASGRTEEEIIIMASIIEKEAITKEDKYKVSGILWKRIKIGMALQVDAPFVYGIGKNTFQLTTKDLRIDSLYNTYTNKGLTPTPIANPGLESIIAAIKPEESPYLFYLSDRDGNMYYARDFEEHKKNKARYLY